MFYPQKEPTFPHVTRHQSVTVDDAIVWAWCTPLGCPQIGELRRRSMELVFPSFKYLWTVLSSYFRLFALQLRSAIQSGPTKRTATTSLHCYIAFAEYPIRTPATHCHTSATQATDRWNPRQSPARVQSYMARISRYDQGCHDRG